MKCPHCNSDRAKRNGHTAAGTPRYYCNSCRRSFVAKAKKRGKGRKPPKYASNAEKQKAYRERQKTGNKKPPEV